LSQKAFQIQAIYMFGNGYARQPNFVYDQGYMLGFDSLSLSLLCVYDGMRDLGVIRPPRTPAADAAAADDH
jgi:hypothetical protein